MKNHQKHAAIARPDYGFFGRNEWAIVGTPCGNIKKLAFQLTEYFSQQYKVGYVDADHAAPKEEDHAGTYGAALEYVDKIAFHRFDTKLKMNVFQYRQKFQEIDLVLVNGNHFEAKQQIVVIDPTKEASLKKRLHQLTDVQLILLMETGQEIYPFLQAHLPSHPPILLASDVAGIRDFFKQTLQQTLPPLYGLVLAGGESRRMGQDKGLLDYHGKPQREYTADLLDQVCEKTFISVRAEQEIQTTYSVLSDTFLNLGPSGAILSAFREHPNAAWLVAACDLPLLDRQSLQQLVQHRNRSKVATAFQSTTEPFPEPLLAIWEPKAYAVLLQFLAQGYSCPRKALLHSDIELLEVANPDALRNVNAPEERNDVQKFLQNQIEKPIARNN